MCRLLNRCPRQHTVAPANRAELCSDLHLRVHGGGHDAKHPRPRLPVLPSLSALRSLIRRRESNRQNREQGAILLGQRLGPACHSHGRVESAPSAFAALRHRSHVLRPSSFHEQPRPPHAAAAPALHARRPCLVPHGAAGRHATRADGTQPLIPVVGRPRSSSRLDAHSWPRVLLTDGPEPAC